jgi:hypothetical protein
VLLIGHLSFSLVLDFYRIVINALIITALITGNMSKGKIFSLVDGCSLIDAQMMLTQGRIYSANAYGLQ